jgi:prophage regulatory protein
MSFTNRPLPGFLRLRSILRPEGPLPISKSAWFRGIAAGRYPKPVKLGPNTTVWREQDIRALCERVAASQEGLAA